MESLRVRLDQNEAAAAWLPIPELADLAPGDRRIRQGRHGLRGLPIGRKSVRVSRSLSGRAKRWLVRDWSAGWAIAANLILVCPHCRARYDTRRAGLGLDGDHHLEPLPLLQRDGVLSVAVLVASKGELCQ